MNAFDVVRIHKFGGLDDNADENTEQKKLPSFKAMQEFAVNDDKVKIQLAEERMSEAYTEFDVEDDSWKTQLEYNKQGVLVNSVRNMMLILNYDPDLANFGYNEMAGKIQVTGVVPWERPKNNKFWRDADTAQLKALLDSRYVAFSTRNHDVAFTKISDDRSFHPIREYLDSLPEWDRISRLDTLLVDYFGAENTSYTRAEIGRAHV